MHICNLYDYSFLQKLFVFTVNEYKNIAIAGSNCWAMLLPIPLVLVHVGPIFFTYSNIGH